MHTATLSPKFQLSIPKALREELNLQAGQKFVLIPKGDIIALAPQHSIAWARGLLKGHATTDYRDRSNRV